METIASQERADALVRQGQTAAQAGQQELARRYLQAAVDIDPGNATAWLWLAGVQEPAEARVSLKRVLELEPDNARARAGLAWVEQQLADIPPPSFEEPKRGTGPLRGSRPGTGPLARGRPVGWRGESPRGTGILGRTGGTGVLRTPFSGANTGVFRTPGDPSSPPERPAEPDGTQVIAAVAEPSAEQVLRAQLREARVTGALVRDEDEDAASRPDVRVMEETEPVDPAARRWRRIFLLLVVLLLVGLVVLGAGFTM